MINGRQYDAGTGMPVINQKATAGTPAHNLKTNAAHTPRPTGAVMSDVAPRPKSSHLTLPAKKPVQAISKPANHQKTDNQTAAKGHAAQQVHKRMQRSQTLHRGATKRPESSAANVKQPVRRSNLISKFAPSHSVQSKPTFAPTQAATLKTMPTAQNQRPQAKPSHIAQPPVQQHKAPHPTRPATLTGSLLKEQLIKERMHDAKVHTHDEPATPGFKDKLKQRRPRVATVMSSIGALVILGGYLTYLNLPSLSIRVAAVQAGFDATYPTYQPAGYSFTGPVAYSPGEVRVGFQSNTNDYNYNLIQRSSSWDSQAVLDNYVLPRSEQYATLQERGLTIYLMENKAAWVNGGVLYVIDGNAPLSSEQIQKIASSTL